ncbi:MAG: ComF family protein [Clostridia bacterium]|nr:ComF family protein [Clostridia bacterium]
MKVLDAVIGMIFPRTCAVCGERADAESGYALCGACRNTFELEKISRCAECGKPSKDCRCRPSVYYRKNTEYIHLIEYKSEFSKRLIFSLKRRGLRPTVDFLAGELAKAVAQREDISYVAFAPRSKSSVGEYGFDQSKLLARALAKKLYARFVPLISHTKRSVEQKTLGLSGRVDNAADSYSLSKNKAVQGTLIIVDDVITSGATAKTLCELGEFAGAERIIVLTVAKTAAHKNF